MHPMIAESIRLAKAGGYLDRLHSVYDVSDVGERVIPDRTLSGIAEAYANRDQKELVKVLLNLDKFPIDDIWVGILRKDESLIDSNPETVKRLGDKLLTMPMEELLKRCRQPKVDNRRMGELFHKWFTNLPYPKLPEETLANVDEFTDIQGVSHKVLTLDGTRKDFRDFININAGCGLEKELDVLVKVNGQYVIGEAKYFSDFGGHQMGQFKDAVDDFLLSTQGNATRIAILDGVIWLDTQNEMNRKIRNLESIAMSALLFPSWLQSILGDAP
jgi:hypothetical protein